MIFWTQSSFNSVHIHYAIGFKLSVIFNSRKTNHDVIKVFFDLMVWFESHETAFVTNIYLFYSKSMNGWDANSSSPALKMQLHIRMTPKNWLFNFFQTHTRQRSTETKIRVRGCIENRRRQWREENSWGERKGDEVNSADF